MTSDYNASRVRDRYQGRTAEMYEEMRATGKGRRKWKAENDAVETLLEGLHNHHVVDIPVGTGRYAKTYAANDMRVTGLDTSIDMMAIALNAFIDHEVPCGFMVHDILQPLPAKYDIAVCTRLVNHFTLEETQLAVKNLVAAAPIVILGLRERKIPTEKNWHLLLDVLPSNAKETHRVTMSDGVASRYLMLRIARVD